MVAALDPDNAADAARAYELGSLHRVGASYLEQSDLYGAAFEEDNMAEVVDLLGHRPADWQQAEAELERFVLTAGPEHDATLGATVPPPPRPRSGATSPRVGYLTGSKIQPIA